MRMYVGSALFGVVCFVMIAFSGQYFSRSIPEWVPQLAWLGLVIGGSALCGYLRPERAWRWGAIIVGIQPVAALVLIPVLDSLNNSPKQSTGGLVAVAIFTVLALVFSPVAILVSYAAARRAAKV